MARTNRIPKLRKHSTGQGFIELCGRRFYCGHYGDPATEAKAQRLTHAWLANGRRLPRNPEYVTVVELTRASRRVCTTFSRSARRGSG